MKILSDNLRISVDNPNSNVFPVITIGTHVASTDVPVSGASLILSTKFPDNTFASSFLENYLPILNEQPTFNKSLDIGKAVYKTSQMTVKIINTKYDGKNIIEHHDLITPNTLVSSEIKFWLVGANCTIFEEALLMYSGYIKSVSTRKDFINFKCEDFSSVYLNKKVPYRKLNASDYGDYSLVPYPINYGSWIYSPLYQNQTKNEDVRYHGVFDHDFAYYGESPVAGVRFFSDENEAKMSEYTSGLFLKYNSNTDEYEGIAPIFDRQWINHPNVTGGLNLVVFENSYGRGTPTYIGEDRFEAEFHFNKTGVRGTGSANMYFENIIVPDTLYPDAKDAGERHMFPFQEIPADTGVFTYFGGNHYWVGTKHTYEDYDAFPFEIDLGDEMDGVQLDPMPMGILWNNQEIVNVDGLKRSTYMTSATGETIKIANLTELGEETQISGNIGVDPNTMNAAGMDIGDAEYPEQDYWPGVGFTSGVEATFTEPPSYDENYRIFFTLEMDLMARIINSPFTAQPPPYADNADYFASNFYSYFARCHTEDEDVYSGSRFLEESDTHANIGMPCMPGLIYYIDNKAAGGWWTTQNACNLTNDLAEWGNQSAFAGVEIKMGTGFATQADNQRTNTSMESDSDNFDTGFNSDTVNWINEFRKTVLAQTYRDYDIDYTEVGHITSSFGMFVDSTGGGAFWGNQNKDRGHFIIDGTPDFNKGLPVELQLLGDPDVDGDPDEWDVRNMLAPRFEDVMIFYTERGTPPETFTLCSWDSCHTAAWFTAPTTTGSGEILEGGELGNDPIHSDLWIRGLGYSMIYMANDFLHTEFYAYLRNGRMIEDTGYNTVLQTFETSSTDIISNPAAVMTDIIIGEFGYEMSYDGTTAIWGDRWNSAYYNNKSVPIWYVDDDGVTQNYNHDFHFSFSLQDEIDGKKILQELGENSRVMPYFDGNKLGFNLIEPTYVTVAPPEAMVGGCTNPDAANYAENANSDNSTCIAQDNFGNWVNEDEWIYGCWDETALTQEECEVLGFTYGWYNEEAFTSLDLNNNLCLYDDGGELVYGCMDPNADNYDPDATIDDGLCFTSEDGEIKVEFTLITASNIPMFDYADGSSAASNMENAIAPILDFNTMGDSYWANFSTVDNNMRVNNNTGDWADFGWINGGSWSSIEGGYPYHALGDYPANSIIIHGFHYKQPVIGDGDPDIHAVINDNSTFFLDVSTTEDPFLESDFYPYFQTAGTTSSYQDYFLGAGFQMHDYYLTDTDLEGYDLPASSFGILVESATLMDEQRIYGIGGMSYTLMAGDAFMIIRRYHIVGRLPRPEQVIASDVLWRDWIPQDPYFTTINSLTCCTNEWIYTVYDNSMLEYDDLRLLDNLFNYSYIQTNIENLTSNGINKVHEAGNVPIDITIVGIDWSTAVPEVVPGTFDHDLRMGYCHIDFWTNGFGVGVHKKSTIGGYAQNAQILQMSNGNWHTNYFPSAFMQVKSHEGADDVFGYCYPNQSQVLWRNYIGNTNQSGEGNQYGGSFPMGGMYDTDVYLNTTIGASYGYTATPTYTQNYVLTKEVNYENYQTGTSIDGYYPVGINWYLGSPNRRATTGKTTRDSDLSFDRVISKDDVIKYKVSQTIPEKVLGRCKVKYGYRIYKDDFDFSTEWFYWKDIPSVKLYHEEEGVAVNDTTLQTFYNLPHYEVLDEDGETTQYKQCELIFESKYVNDVHSARSLAQYMLGWRMNVHTTIDLDLPLKYCDLEVGDVVAIDKLLGDDLTINQEDYSYKYFQSQYIEFEGQVFTTRMGQVIYPLFMITKVKMASKGSLSVSLIQIHDWCGRVAHKSWLDIIEGEPPESTSIPGTGESGINYGCSDPDALNFDEGVHIHDDDLCIYPEEDGILYDVNGDGGVDILDVIMIMGYILGSADLTEAQIIAADGNADGGVDILDVVAAINIILNG